MKKNFESSWFPHNKMTFAAKSLFGEDALQTRYTVKLKLYVWGQKNCIERFQCIKSVILVISVLLTIQTHS